MELNTYGDLKKVIKAISTKQKGEKIGQVALDTVVGFIPGADAAKSTFDFIKAAFSKPDSKKTKTWLDKLDIDDEMTPQKSKKIGMSFEGIDETMVAALTEKIMKRLKTKI